MSEEYGVAVSLTYIDETDEACWVKLHGKGNTVGYALENTNPGMLRIWGDSPDDPDGITMLVPINRVIRLIVELD